MTVYSLNKSLLHSESSILKKVLDSNSLLCQEISNFRESTYFLFYFFYPKESLFSK